MSAKRVTIKMWATNRATISDRLRHTSGPHPPHVHAIRAALSTMPYTTDWFSGNASVWNDEDGPLGDLLRRAQVSPMSALEIGVWEGRSTVWLLENLCMKTGSKDERVDHFDGGETQAGKDRFERVLLNTRECNQHGALDLRPGWSSVVLIDLRLKERVFDLAYIDG